MLSVIQWTTDFVIRLQLVYVVPKNNVDCARSLQKGGHPSFDFGQWVKWSYVEREK